MRVSRVMRVKPVYMRLPGFCQSVLEACWKRVMRVRGEKGVSRLPPEKRPLCPANRLFQISKSFSRPRSGRAGDVQRLTRLRRHAAPA